MTKLRVKVGAVEVEYEGEESFSQHDLLALLDALKVVQPASGETPTERTTPSVGSDSILRSVSDAAQKLQASSGADLITAAAAYITFVEGKQTFKREEVIAGMRSASAYFKETYIGNMTSYLRGRVRNDVLSEQSKDTYALTAKAQRELRDKLGIGAA